MIHLHNKFRSGLKMGLSTLATITLWACMDSAALAQTAQSGATSDEINRAHAIIQNTLIDPSSVQYRNITVTRIGHAAIFCGELNSKNSFGGYTGFQPFVLFGQSPTIYKGVPGTEGKFREYSTMLCDGGPKVSVPNF